MINSSINSNNKLNNNTSEIINIATTKIVNNKTDKADIADIADIADKTNNINGCIILSNNLTSNKQDNIEDNDVYNIPKILRKNKT